MVIQERLYTVKEFEDIIARPENAERLLELVNGEIVEKNLSQEHGIITATIGAETNLYLRANPIGLAAVEARHRPAGDEHNDRLPDVSVVLDVSKPVEREGAALYMPDVCVEIKSPSDTYKAMTEKAEFYLTHGTKMVILVYPEKRLVEVITPTSRDLLGEDETITGGDVLPNLAIKVSAVFAGV